MRKGPAASEANEKVRKYAAVTLILVALALVSFLITPSCNNLLLTSNKYTCISNLAIEKSNASICGTLQGAYSDSCYLQFAVSKKNGTVCMAIADSSTRSSCASGIAEATNDYALCGAALEPHSSMCEEKVALALYNQSLCSSIANSAYRTACSSILGIRLAISSNSTAYCLDVTSSTDKNVTRNIIANVSYGAAPGDALNGTIMLGSVFLTQNVTYTARDLCYTTLAYQSGNVSVCSNVSAGSARELCALRSTTSTSSSANYTQLIAGCNQAGVYRQYCMQSVELSEAIRTMNASMCGLLGASSSSCYTLLASTYRNASYCRYISDYSLRNACVTGS